MSKGIIKRTPPNNFEAEKSVLGAILIDANSFYIVSGLLTPKDFYYRETRAIYETLISMEHEKKPLDVISVISELKAKKRIQEAGGESFLYNLDEYCATSANILYHANMIKDMSKKRDIITVAACLQNKAYDINNDTDAVVEDAQQKIFAMSDDSMAKSASSDSKSTFKDVFANIRDYYGGEDKITGIPTGFMALDKILLGLHDDNFIIVAARPSMGKTAFALNIMANAVLHQHIPTLIFSLEMSKRDLAVRLLASESGLAPTAVDIDNCSDDEKAILYEKGDELANAPFFFNEKPAISIAELTSEARKMKAKNNIGLIIIDYLQLMNGDKNKKYGDNKQQEIADISRAIKSLAKELNIPIIALSQLSRGVESRNDKRPMLSDLRESGQLEQDADVVIALYRDDYYHPDTEQQNVTEAIVLKHRNGRIGKANLYFKKDIGKFTDIVYREEDGNGNAGNNGNTEDAEDDGEIVITADISEEDEKEIRRYRR